MCSLPVAKETSLKNPEIGSMSISSSKMTWQCRIQQECIPVGCVPSATVAVSGGVCLLPGGCQLWTAVSALGGGIPACTEADLPPVDRQTLVKT